MRERKPVTIVFKNGTIREIKYSWLRFEYICGELTTIECKDGFGNISDFKMADVIAIVQAPANKLEEIMEGIPWKS